MSMSSRGVLAGTAIVLCLAAGAAYVGRDSFSQAGDAPTPVSAKLNSLSPEKRAFISDPQQLARFNLTPEKLQLAIADFDAAALDRYVTSLMNTVASERFQEGRDEAETPLNIQASRFNSPTTLRPAIMDEYKRDPGPFSLDRYLEQKGGIPTFARAPIAIRKEDLVAGKVDVAFMGVPLDMSSGYRDAKRAPVLMRSLDGLTGVDPTTQINPNLELKLADYGNFTIDFLSVERTMDHVRTMVRDVASVGTIPFIAGGDHGVMYADVAGVVDQYGKGNVSVVLIDAHAESKVGSDHLISDNQSVHRLMQDGIVSGGDITMVALRDPTLNAEGVDRLKKAGIRTHSMADIEQRGWSKGLDDVLKSAKRGASNVFISFDISALDPAYAPGAGRPVPGGLTVRDAKELVLRLCTENKIVGFEMLDVAPIMDVSYKTVQNANSIMHSCLTGIAARKIKQTARR